MRKLRIANVAVLLIMILVMVLVDCEMVKPTSTTTFKLRLKAQSPEPASTLSIPAYIEKRVGFPVSPRDDWGALAPS